MPPFPLWTVLEKQVPCTPLILSISEVEGAALERKVNCKANALYGKQRLFCFQILLCFSFWFGRGFCYLWISKGDFWPVDSTLHVVIPDSLVSYGKDTVSLGTGWNPPSGTLGTWWSLWKGERVWAKDQAQSWVSSQSTLLMLYVELSLDHENHI